MACYTFSALNNLAPNARVLVAGGTGIVGSGVVQAIVKQGIKVIVGTRSLERFNCLREATPEKFRHNLSVVLGDVKTQPGAQSVFDQVSTDFGGVQHVIATMRDRKIWWQCGRMWDQSLYNFYAGSQEEAVGHYLLMRLFVPYLTNVTGSSYTVVTGYPGNVDAPPATCSSLMCLKHGTLRALAEAARVEQRAPRIPVCEVHIRCLVHRKMDRDVCFLGSQHLGHDLVGSVVSSVAAAGVRKDVVILGREGAMDWARAETISGPCPCPPSDPPPCPSPSPPCPPPSACPPSPLPSCASPKPDPCSDLKK